MTVAAPESALQLMAWCMVCVCGSVQGIRVGEFWSDRLDCRQWGAHFPHVAGIAGQSNQGAQSVVLSGGCVGQLAAGVCSSLTSKHPKPACGQLGPTRAAGPWGRHDAALCCVGVCSHG